MLRHVRIIVAEPRWKALLVAAGLMAASARFAVADADALTLDDNWFATLARAESTLAGARAGSDIDAVDRVAVAEQIRLSVYVLGFLIRASIAADTLLAGPIAVARQHQPPSRGWGNRVTRMAGVVAAVTSLLPMLASLRGASPRTQRVLAYIGGSAAGIGGLLHRSRESRTLDPASDSIERIRMVGLESDLRDAVQGTERAAESLWEDLRGMALDSCATGGQIVSLARRYVNAFPAASEVLESGVGRSAAIARSCAEHPGFDKEARERFGALASHLVAIGDLWHERRWLFERSRRNALDCLVLIDHP